MMDPSCSIETLRLNALDQYDLLDSPREEAFDRITRLVCRFLGVQSSTVSLIDGHRQWFKAGTGVDVKQTARSAAICDHTIRQAEPLVIADTLADPTFRDHPAVTGPLALRFYAGIPIRSADGFAVGTLCAFDRRPRELEIGDLQVLVDLAAIVEDELALRLVATTDGLTGALNRRAFHAEGQRAFALAHRHGHEMSAVAFDLDHFKSINDGHGHAAGDAVLAAVGNAAASTLRKSDVFGRVGGEEFAVLLPIADRHAAAAVAEKLRIAIGRLTIVDGPAPIRVTASFGIASRTVTIVELDQLLERADEALYAAKSDGRNRCRVWMQDGEALEPAVKRRVLKAGRIAFNAGRSTLDCTVRSLSEVGAHVDVINSHGLPDKLKLSFEADGFARVCRVTQKRETSIELAFV